MASLRKRGDKWQARVSKTGARSVAKSFTNKADAIKWARKAEIDAEQSTLLGSPQCNITLGAVIARYLREVTPTKKNHRMESYILRGWLKTSIAGKRLGCVSPVDVSKWRDEKLASKTAPGTVRNALAALSAVHRHAALDWGHTSVINPVERIKRPPPGRGRTRRLSGGEIDAVLTATKSPELSTIIAVAVETGMREAEIVGLLRRNVDIERRTALLPDTKNGESRIVPLTTNAIHALEGTLHKAGEAAGKDGRLFAITPHAVSVAFRRAVQRARRRYEGECAASGATPDKTYLLDLRFHDLRHEAVSRLFEKGLNPMEVAAISGHKTLSMLKRYTHLRAEDLAKKLG